MRVVRKAQAAQYAANVLPIIRDIRAAGHTSLNGISKQSKLNAERSLENPLLRHDMVTFACPHCLRHVQQ